MSQFNGVVDGSRKRKRRSVKRYEGLFILDTAGKEETIKDTIDKISADITSAGGKVETVQKMDKKQFHARGRQEAHRRLLRECHFREPADGARPARNKFAMNEEVFRVLFTEALG